MKKINSDYTIVGKIINTRGIRGEVKVFPMTPVKERFSDLDHVFVGDELDRYEIKKVSYDGKYAYLTFDRYENINLVLGLKEEFVYIEDENRIELDEDTFFISDIISCKVFDTEKQYIGELVDIMEIPANDVYVIKGENGEEYLIPAVKQFVKSIDTEGKIIVINPIEGMLDEI